MKVDRGWNCCCCCRLMETSLRRSFTLSGGRLRRMEGRWGRGGCRRESELRMIRCRQPTRASPPPPLLLPTSLLLLQAPGDSALNNHCFLPLSPPLCKSLSYHYSVELRRWWLATDLCPLVELLVLLSGLHCPFFTSISLFLNECHKTCCV